MKNYNYFKKEIDLLQSKLDVDDLFLVIVYLNAKISLCILEHLEKINKRIDEVDKQ